MPQLIAITTAGHYTDTQRSALKADIEQQMAGFDVHILILPPGAQIQQGWVPPLTATLIPVRVAQTERRHGVLTEREVQHVDTDEPEAEGIPPHVWLYKNMLTEMQAVAPLGRDETNGQYAVAIDDLTDEQRAIPHVSKQLPGDVLTVAVVGNHEANGIAQRADVR